MDEGQQIYVSNLVGGKDYIPVQARRCNVYLTRLETDRQTDRTHAYKHNPTCKDILSPLSETYLRGQCTEMDSKMGQDLCTFPSHQD